MKDIVFFATFSVNLETKEKTAHLVWCGRTNPGSALMQKNASILGVARKLTLLQNDDVIEIEACADAYNYAEVSLR